MTVRPRVVLPLLALLLAAGCGRLVAGGLPDELSGRTFLSTAVTENRAPKALVAGTRIRLSFDREGRRISANAGCNHMGGQARIEGGRLVVTDLAMTAMGCDPARHEQDGWLGAFLGAGPTARTSGTELVLTTATAEIRLVDREVADPDRPLRGTRWVLESIIDRDVASSIPTGAQAHLTLNADGSFVGSAGCNEVGGSATTTDATIRFGDLHTTKMLCTPDRMRVEQAVLDVLRGEVGYELEADLLRLRHASGKGLDLRAAR